MALSEQQQHSWENNGFLILPKFYSKKEIKKLNSHIRHLWKTRHRLKPSYVIDVFVETEQEKRLYFCDAPAAAQRQPYKLNDLFLNSDVVRKIAAGERITPILSELLGGDTPMICNSLNFEFGSQQDFHVDTFFMPSPTPNKMIASWVALEDVTADSGPLTYYPASHKIPPYLFSNGKTNVMGHEMPAFSEYINKEIAERNLKPETFLAKQGDVFIWHSQLFHGGYPIANKRKTRRSLVTHYFTQEDFKDENIGSITAGSKYMLRKAQPTGYPYKQPEIGWKQRLFAR